MTGTIINVGTVVAGSLLGLWLGNRLLERFRTIVFQGIGLFTLLLGVMMALKSQEPLVLVLSMVTGGLLGEWARLDERLERSGEWLKRSLGSSNDRFAEGALTAFLLFCMGSMIILGALEEGLGGDPDLLITKAIMDGFSSIALSAALGLGVLFSVVPLLLYQGGLTLLAAWLEPFLTEAIMAELTAVGGLMLIGMGINILEIKKIKVLNLIPALLMAVLLTWLAGYFGWGS